MPDAYALQRRGLDGEPVGQWVCGYTNGVPGFTADLNQRNTWQNSSAATAVWNEFTDEWRTQVQLKRVKVEKKEEKK
jgi:hypothetical protein